MSGLGEVLVAVNGDDLEAAVLTCARALEVERGAHIRLVTALELPLTTGADALACAEMVWGNEVQDQLLIELGKRVQALLGHDVQWDTTLHFGRLVEAIQVEVAKKPVDLIVLGLHDHNLWARVVFGDRAMNVLQATSAPVFFVREQLNTLPRNIVVAVNFHEGSREALQEAVRLAAPGATVHVVHVRHDGIASAQRVNAAKRVKANEISTDEANLKKKLDELIGEVQSPTGVSIRCAVLEGGREDTEAGLRHYCEGIEPDLLVLGIDSHPGTHLPVLRSLARDLVHSGRWSLLVAHGQQGEGARHKRKARGHVPQDGVHIHAYVPEVPETVF